MSATPVAIVALASLGHDPDALRRRAAELLNRPPYRDGEPGPLREAFDRVVEVVLTALESVLGAAAGTPAIAWLIALIGLVLLALVVWRATRGLTAGSGRSAAMPAMAATRTARDWHDDADRHEADGALRDALRCRYVAAVVGLIEAGVLEDVPGRTVRELDAELERSAPSLAEPMAEAGRRLERVVYGGATVTRDDLEVVTRAAQAVDAAGVTVRSGASA